LSETDFASVLRSHIRKDMNNYADDLANGVCKSFDDYQKLCGVIRGLAIAEEHLTTLLEKAKKSDE
jgi:hypothetical protein